MPPSFATPLAWWIMNRWLQDYAYHVQLSWWMFVLAGLPALVIALGTSGYHAIRAARVNPIISLRDE